MTHLEAFRRGLPEDGEKPSAPVESLFLSLVESSLARYGQEQPDSALQARFLESLGRRAPVDQGLNTWLEQLHFEDLFLAVLAAWHHEASVRRFCQDYVTVCAARQAKSDEARRELAAQVVQHLLVPEPGHEPRLLSYSGRGPLSAWVHMVAKRKAIEVSRGAAGQVSYAQEILKRTPALADPELDVLKFRYAERFNEALEQALRNLGASDANLLYLSSVKRVPLGAMARMEAVSIRTLQRRLTTIRKWVFEETRRLARERLGASEEEMSSLLGLVQSQLDVTLHRVLAPEEKES